MWDSAKKPIKIRSVLQSNGMRHFIVNEETDEVYSNLLQQQQKRKNSNKTCRPDKNDNPDQKLPLTERQKESNTDDSSKKSYPSPLRRSNSHSFGDHHDERSLTSLPENCGGILGVAGNRICNSKKHKGHHHQNRYFHQFPQYIKDANLIPQNSPMSKCPHFKVDMLDLIPVKSPVIKKLISGRSASSMGNDSLQNSKSEGGHKTAGASSSSSSTTLCSRIMTWIDLEVKRNAVKGRTSSSLPFSSADLSIVNDLNGFQSDSSSSPSPSSSSVNSGSTTPSGDGVCASSSSSTDTAVLPKLVPCWRKDASHKSGTLETGSRVKKSVRISEDLPRWGKMKRRLKRQDRSLSLNELYNDDELSVSAFMGSNADDRVESNINSRSKANCQKQYSSVINLADGDRQAQGKAPSWNSGGGGDDDDEKRNSFLVCNENVPTNGRVQVHIFLPQTDNSAVPGKVGVGGSTRTCDNESNQSGRSEDSTF